MCSICISCVCVRACAYACVNIYYILQWRKRGGERERERERECSYIRVTKAREFAHATREYVCRRCMSMESASAGSRLHEYVLLHTERRVYVYVYIYIYIYIYRWYIQRERERHTHIY